VGDNQRDNGDGRACPEGIHGHATYIVRPQLTGDDWALDSGAAVAHEAQASDLTGGAGVLLDYVRVRMPDDAETWAELDGWLGERQMRAGGWRGWYDASADVLDGAIVAWCTQREMAERQGLLIDVPGRACACLGDDLLPFVAWAAGRGRVTRLDVALDDREGRLDIDKMWEYHQRGQVVTRWRRWSRIEQDDDGAPSGAGIYVGRRRSQAFLRFYDKSLQQGQPAGTWMRCELECKGDLADALAREMIEHPDQAGRLAIGQLVRRIRFVEPGTDTNRRRWHDAIWWRAFVRCIGAGPGLVSGEKPELDRDAMYETARRCMAPTLAALVEADGGDLQVILDLLTAGRPRIKPRQRVAIRAAHDETLARLRADWAEHSETEAMR